jgi:hypothetical protein
LFGQGFPTGVWLERNFEGKSTQERSAEEHQVRS